VIVVDASAMLEALLRTPAAEAIEKRIFAAGETLHAPQLLDVEVAQVIRRYTAVRNIDQERGRQTLSDLQAFPIRRYPYGFLLPRVWELRNSLTAYDAVFVALAEALDAPLLTRDRRLATAARRRVRIELT
jgi:predicted nucleic acid-binding protein